ncbi:MAG TPA: amidase [Geminicoccaceae bacterium]|jgi:amidase|nr:amidase [Geminicoccaceae bacterium]
MQDQLNAFVPHGHIQIEGSARGPLAGVAFAVKDIFDVAGVVTGRGNADWLTSHAPAVANAPAVDALLGAGAKLVGKTITEELAFSVIGTNPYYGTPKNVAAPGRVPGGSSSGSAAAVGGGLVPLALGSDTGGSVRVPASYNGIYGMRPSHGRISLDGVMPLAPSFDTVGWFTREPGLFATAGRVLLGDDAKGGRPDRVLIATDTFARLEPGVENALRPAIRQIEAWLGAAEAVVVSEDGLDAWYDAFRVLQGAEAWAAHGAWIEEARPRLGPMLQERLQFIRTITADQIAAAEASRRRVQARLDALLGDDTIVILPSAAGVAPRIDASVAEHEAVRARVIGITCIASLGGLPQVSLPLGRMAAGPVGLSLLAPRGRDALLLDLVAAGIGELRQPAAS